MLGNFVYSEEIITEDSGNYNAPPKLEKVIKRFLVLAVVFIGGGIIWLFVISPCLMPVKMEINTIQGLNRADILKIAGIPGSATYVSVNAARTEQLISGHYLVESVKVTKRFPDRLSIFIEPRKAVALTLFNFNGRTYPVYIDRYGVIFRIDDAFGTVPNDRLWSQLPVVSGVLNETPRLGMRITSAYLPIFSRIGAISDEDPNLWQAISEIAIARKSGGMFDLILYPVHSSIKLRMGSDISKEKIYYALVMSDVYSQYGASIPEIDVRSGLGVVAREAF